MAGYIKDHRKELDSDIWTMPPLYHRAWQFLKYKANYEDAEIPRADGSTILVRRGQHLTTLRDIAEGIAWREGRARKTPNPHTISKILEFMERRNMIVISNEEKTVRGNRKYTLITLLNWEKYQIDEITGNDARHNGVTNRAQKKKNKEFIITTTGGEVDFVSETSGQYVDFLDDDEPRLKSPHIVVMDAYCKLHGKIDFNLTDGERRVMRELSASMPAEFIISAMNKVLSAKREREGADFDLPGTFTYYQKPIQKAWKAEQGSQTDAQVPALPSVAPGYSSRQSGYRDKHLEARDREIAFNHWIENGGNPHEFEY